MIGRDGLTVFHILEFLSAIEAENLSAPDSKSGDTPGKDRDSLLNIIVYGHGVCLDGITLSNLCSDHDARYEVTQDVIPD